MIFSKQLKDQGPRAFSILRKLREKEATAQEVRWLDGYLYRCQRYLDDMRRWVSEQPTPGRRKAP